MEKERIALLAQLLSSMKEAAINLEAAMKNEDMEQLSQAKKQMSDIQKQIDKLI